MLLVTTGDLGTRTPPGGIEGGWVPSSNGKFYQAHDLGNLILMAPAAWLGAALSSGPPGSLIDTPPIISKVGVALSHACLSAIGCFFMFRLLSLDHPTGRRALLLALAFPTTTVFWAYAKTAWDVMGAACFMCALLYFSAEVLRGRRPARSACLAAVVLAAACTFRFSLAPFFVPGLVGVLYLSRRELRPWHWLAVAACFLCAMAPTLAYNEIRMDSPLRPATTAPQYLESNNALTGSIPVGLFGLLLSPNRGIFLFSPILILLFLLPSVWRETSRTQRHLLTCFGGSAVAYMLLISKMKNWGGFGWGPRYLLPVVPILFYGTATVLAALWDKHRRALVALSLASGLLSAAPVLVNWHLATTTFPRADDPYALLPRQQVAIWSALLMGLQGRPLPVTPDVADDPIRSAGARFPDLWTVRLMERSPAGMILGLGISLALLLGCLWSFRRLVRSAGSGGLPVKTAPG